MFGSDDETLEQFPDEEIVQDGQSDVPQPSDEIVENDQLELNDGENTIVDMPDKTDPFTPIIENNVTYETVMEVHAAAIEDFCSQQLELLKGIYINQLFFIGSMAAVLVVLVLYNFLRKFF